MERFFNTTGPCDAEKHYMLGPEQRIPDLMPYIKQEQYFVVHAARQTGKSTAMMAFAERLRGLGHTAVYATLETSQARDVLEEAESVWLESIRRSASIQLPPAAHPPAQVDAPIGERLGAMLTAWTQALPATSLILLLDEVDVIRGVPLVNLLRQLRAGFITRPTHFPASVGLVGMRDLRDYLSHAKDGTAVNPGSPFNIKSASLTVRNFTTDEVVELYAQHTDDTGQVFTAEASARAFWWTQGQPFLVNALARICVMELVTDPAQPIEVEHIDLAKERLVRARTTHLDSLAERLKEERVATIIQAVVTGDIPRSIPYDHDDYQYVVDLGLIRMGDEGVEPANPLYREVLARQLTHNLQQSLTKPRWRWQTEDGRLDFPALVDAFLDWWRENADSIYAHGNKQYPEALAHLAFMAFLQRVVNGGGTVIREFAAGRRAVDIVVTYGQDRFVVELKRVFKGGKSLEKVREEGVVQLADYLETLDETTGWLIVFDQRQDKSWDERLWKEERDVGARRLLMRGA